MCTKIITRPLDCVDAMHILVTRGTFLNLNQGMVGWVTANITVFGSSLCN